MLPVLVQLFGSTLCTRPTTTSDRSGRPLLGFLRLASNTQVDLVAPWQQGHPLCGTETAFHDVMLKDSRSHRARSRCDGANNWFQHLLQRHTMLRQASTFVYFNVGANTGYNIAVLLQQLTSAPISNQEWHSQMLLYIARTLNHTSSRYSCGSCLNCHIPRQEQELVVEMPVVVHAFEILPMLHAWLEWAFRHFSIRGSAVLAAGSNVSGHVRISSVARHKRHFGWEAAGMSTVKAPMTVDSRWGPIEHFTSRSLSIDDYTRANQIDHIHYVSIDAENYDGVVLEGMQGMLERNAVDLVEFEKNDIPWEGSYSFSSTLIRLAKSGYECFWQGLRCLVPISGACFNATIVEQMGGGNVLCSHGTTLGRLREQTHYCMLCPVNS